VNFFVWIRQNSDFLWLGVLLCLTHGLGNVALHYVYYPIKVVFKSCKLLVVMLGGRVFFNESHAWRDYLGGIVVTLGLILFTLTDAAVSPRWSTYGILLLTASVAGEAFLTNLTQKVFRQGSSQHPSSPSPSSPSSSNKTSPSHKNMSPSHKSMTSPSHKNKMNGHSLQPPTDGSSPFSFIPPSSIQPTPTQHLVSSLSTTTTTTTTTSHFSPSSPKATTSSGFSMETENILGDPVRTEMVFVQYLIGAVIIGCITLWTGEVWDALAYLIDPEVPVTVKIAIPVFAGCVYAGLVVVLLIVSRYGAVVTTFVTSCRRLFSLLLSFLLFPKPFQSGHLVGVIMVFGGILLVDSSKDHKKSTTSRETH